MGSTTAVLMECVQLLDEWRDLKTELGDDQRRFKLTVKSLTWEDPDTMDVARQVYQCLQQEDTIAGMVQKIPCNEASIYKVLAQMQQEQMIA